MQEYYNKHKLGDLIVRVLKIKIYLVAFEVSDELRICALTVVYNKL